MRSHETRSIEVLEYELNPVLHGNSPPAEFLDDIQDWGLVVEREPMGIGTTFRYIVSRLTPLPCKIEQTGISVEGWLHFHVSGVYAKEIEDMVHRLSVITPKGTVTTEQATPKYLQRAREFQKVCDLSRAE